MAINQTVFIRGSVGKGAVNSDPDVRAIQTQLNGQMPPSGFRLAVDGRIGPKTNDAICDFQKSVLGFRRPDSRVDPNGKTLRALNDPASESKWARMCVASPLPVPTPPQDKKLSSLWLGVGEAHSGDLVALGYFNWNARVYRLGASDDGSVEWATLSSYGGKVGGGLGGSYAPLLVFAHGVESASKFNSDFSWGDMDWDLALYGSLKAYIESLKHVGKVIKLMDEYKKLSKAGQDLIRNNAFVKPGVYTISIPTGPIPQGVHVWFGRKYGKTVLVGHGTGLG